jgi:NADPH:quinone reductase-like Zn-dependent oxidoreductase
MNRLIAAHPKIAKPIIDKVFEWEEAIEAYKHLESRAHVGKVVIRVAKS